LAASADRRTCSEEASHSEQLACELAVRNLRIYEEFASVNKEASEAQEGFQNAVSVIFNDLKASADSVGCANLAADTNPGDASEVENLSDIDVQADFEPARSSCDEPFGRSPLQDSPSPDARRPTQPVDRVRAARNALEHAAAERVEQCDALRSVLADFHERWPDIASSGDDSLMSADLQVISPGVPATDSVGSQQSAVVIAEQALQGVAVSMQEDAPRWSVDLAFSLGHTADGGRGKVMFLDAETYPSVQTAVAALNAGTILCPHGMCVVRSERQKLYFLVARSDKQQACAIMARDVFQVKTAEQPFPGELAAPADAAKASRSDDRIGKDDFELGLPRDVRARLEQAWPSMTPTSQRRIV